MSGSVVPRPSIGISQTSIIFAFLGAGFIVFISAKGQLGAWGALFTSSKTGTGNSSNTTTTKNTTVTTPTAAPTFATDGTVGTNSSVNGPTAAQSAQIISSNANASTATNQSPTNLVGGLY